MLYLEKQDLSHLTPEELVDLYDKTLARIVASRRAHSSKTGAV